MPNFCPKCGLYSDQNENYCVRCGNAIVTSTSLSVFDVIDFLSVLFWIALVLFVVATLAMAAWKFVRWAWS